jgi:hypothetical protein
LQLGHQRRDGCAAVAVVLLGRCVRAGLAAGACARPLPAPLIHLFFCHTLFISVTHTHSHTVESLATRRTQARSWTCGGLACGSRSR